MTHFLCPFLILPFLHAPISILLMSEQPELWSCSQCGMQQDISQLGFFAEIQCPQCGRTTHVHTMLANYKVESILGIGGMSVVFQARDLVLSRPLAIKVLNDTYRDAPERIAGFENECSLMAKVRHENVVSVYSAGWARGQFFIAMELVEGRNLELIVAEQGALPPLQAIEIIRQVALGLQAASEVGILHRDVKPGNVLITVDGHAKVLDFGLSLDEKGGQDEEEIIWATPYYVPPETLRREEENVQTDIYALGMSLRNLLTGIDKLPDEPQTVADMLVSKKTLASLSQLAPDMHPGLCELVDRMTAFAPEDRPSDYAELLDMIVAVRQDLLEESDPEAIKRRKRQKLYIAAGAAASVALGALGAFVVALLTPESTVQEVLNADNLVWHECEAYAAAVEQFKSGDKGQAAAALGVLTTEETEPAVAAAATLLRTALDALEGKATANGYKRFAEVAARKDQVAPMGRTSFEKMVELVAALQQDAAKASELGAALESPLLKAAAQILVADCYVHSGDAAKAESMVALALETINTTDAATLKSQVEVYRGAAPRRAARMKQESVKALFRAGRFDEAIAMVPTVQQLKLSAVEKMELNVMSEASAIMRVIHDTLQKKGRKVSPGMSPVDLRTSAAGLGETENLPREFYCVALILSGDFDGAFRENPYAADAENQEPFAIIMRDWKTRLGK